VKLAFIVAAYNAEPYLARALDSVLRQSGDNWELIVVDDGSTDATYALACQYASRDGRVRVFHQANTGAANARNTAIEHVSADFVAYLDADDELADDYLASMLGLMNDYPDRDIYSSDGLFIEADGTTQVVLGYDGVVNVSIEDLLQECWILGGGALIRTDALRALGGFREHLYGEDYDLWMRALAAGYTHVGTPEPLYRYHRDVSGRKSEDPEAGRASAATALKDLIESGTLTRAQVRQARARVHWYAHHEKSERRIDRLRGYGRRLLGDRLFNTARGIARSLIRAVRPRRRPSSDGGTR